MRMLLEEPSLIEVAPHRHTPPSRIVRYARACALLIAGVIGAENAQGEDIFTNTRDTIAASLPSLEHPDFITRANAQIHIQQTIENALLQKNPLPPEITKPLESSLQGNISAELRSRLGTILASTAHQSENMPGRILSSEQLNLPLYAILEQQFNLPIRVQDQTQEFELKKYRGGENGQTSTEALQELCTNLCCIPIFHPHSIELVPLRSGDSLKVSDTVFTIVQPSSTKRQITHELSPDKGIILFSSRPLICWQKIKPHLPESYLPHNLPIETNRLLIASRPETLLLDLHEQKPAYSANVTLGAQPSELTLQPSLRKVIQYKNVTYYSTTIQGHARMDIDPLVQQEIDLPKLDCLANVASSEAMKHARIIAFDENGKEIPVTIIDVHHKYGDFTITVMSAHPINRLSITMHTSITQKTIQIPK